MVSTPIMYVPIMHKKVQEEEKIWRPKNDHLLTVVTDDNQQVGKLIQRNHKITDALHHSHCSM